MKQTVFLLLIVALLCMAKPAQATSPDYKVPGEFVLPWSCGQGHRVTWDPAGHWQAHKATGVAFDFSMAEGTPILSPIDGTAYYLDDQRPLETTFGHYIEVVDQSGQWLIRLAHLRDHKLGQRSVEAGELLGYSGSSGVLVPHLHLEVLVQKEGQWVCPDLDRLDRFFGFPINQFVEGAILTNDHCTPLLSMDGEVKVIGDQQPLGQQVRLLVPIRNKSPEHLDLTGIQLSLYSPEGLSMIADAEGTWQLEPDDVALLPIAVRPAFSGEWYVGRVTCESADRVEGLPARGSFMVAPSALALVKIDAGKSIRSIGERLAMEVGVHNSTDRKVEFQDLVIEGSDSDGIEWEAQLGHSDAILPQTTKQFTLYGNALLQSVGEWQAERIAYQQGDQLLYFAPLSTVLTVTGPQLELASFDGYATAQGLHVFVTLMNTGTQPSRADSLEAWGWRSDGESISVRLEDPPKLAVGQSAFVHLLLPATEGEAPRLAGLGYWVKGLYYPLGTPQGSTTALENSCPVDPTGRQPNHSATHLDPTERFDS